MPRASSIVLMLVASAGCGGEVDRPASVATDPSPAPSPSGQSSASPAPSTKPAPSQKSEPRTLTVASCAEAGCQTAFRCNACGAELVCDDTHGNAACVTVETFFECGDGTVFCNSSCGVCLVPGTACVIDSCEATAKPCGRGACCGSGTRCVDDVCVLDQ